MKAAIVSIFPELFDPFLRVGLLGKAVARGLLTVERVDPRSFTSDRHRSVDDAPYGGGAGMVMKPEPLVAAMEEAERRLGGRGLRVLLSPQGRAFGQAIAERYALAERLVLLCGRYEGVDERVRSFVDEEVSLGDFVLMGGEVAAMAVLEASARFVPGVLGNEASPLEESHAAGLLEHPHYTRPVTFRGCSVPEVLRSGDHGAVSRWRRKESLRRTALRRPDLLLAAPLQPSDFALLEELAAEGVTLPDTLTTVRRSGGGS